MGALVRKLLGFLWEGSGTGAALTNVGKWAALAAVIVPAWQWFEGHRNEVAVSFTWAQLAVVGLIVYALLEIAHRSRGPGQ